jgi:hypothetical protein
VTDIMRYYDLWSSRGAKFVTEPKVHATELRCYIRDPDGYLIESRTNHHDSRSPGLVRVTPAQTSIELSLCDGRRGHAQQYFPRPYNAAIQATHQGGYAPLGLGQVKGRRRALRPRKG